ncbi:MAG: lysozyme [Bacteroidales bacterium]|nr:lysozyme [Bacteroidales bacterium]
MKTSVKGIEFIQSFEGLRLKAYKCVPQEKYYTIGYGHYGADVKECMTITRKQAELLFRKDLQPLEDGISALNLNIRQNQFDALVSFAYNLGLGALKSSTLLKKIKINPNDPSIRQEFMRWVYSGSQKLKGLERRRKAEVDLYFSLQ